MRDAFGGVFMIQLFLVFIFIYVGFTAISLNYAKAFKVKNKVIDFIETNEIQDFDKYLSEGSGENQSKFEQILSSASYVVSCDNIVMSNTSVVNKNRACFKGVTVEKIDSPNDISNKYVYYRVTTAVNWDLGVLNLLLSFGGNPNDEKPLGGVWYISGETRVINRS